MRFSSLFFVMALVTHQVGALPPGQVSPGGSISVGGTVGGPSNGQGSPQASPPDRTWTPPNYDNCKRETIDNNVSTGLLYGLLEPGKNIEIQKIGRDQVKVVLPPFISACLDLKINYQQVDNNIFVDFKSEKEISAQEAGYAGREAEFAGLDFEEKYFACVSHKKILKDDYKFDRAKAHADDEISYGLPHDPFRYDIKDPEKSVNVFLMTPFASAAGRRFPAPDHAIGRYPSEPKCMAFDNPSSENLKRLYTSTKDAVYDQAMEACESGNAEAILQQLSELRNSTAGNYKTLEETLQLTFDKIKKERVEEIYKRMTDIENSFKSDKDMSESTATTLAEEYSGLSREISKIVVTPNAQRISDLLKERNDSNKDRIDAEIKRLGDEIQEFSKRDYNKLGFMYDKLKDFALTDDFRAIEGLRLASHFYGRVYEGKTDKRGAPLSFKDATNKVQDHVNQLDETISDWQARYATRNGSRAPILATQARIRDLKGRMDRDYQRFQRRETENARKYCGNNMLGMMSNPVRCRSFMAGRDRRMRSMMNRRSRDLRMLRRQTDNYSAYMTNYEDFIENQQENEDSFNSFGFYSGNSFYTDYDIYGNSNDYSSDFSWMYSMQNPGQQQFRNPAAFSPMGGAPPFAQPGQQGFMMQPNPYATPFN